jgi:ABC-type transporter Mla maintaining outer membrane lipid asymmetry ATPase subunit MlaF
MVYMKPLWVVKFVCRSSEAPQKGVKLVFKDVCVTLSKKNILKKVYGMATVGQMLAVMGPSGMA